MHAEKSLQERPGRSEAMKMPFSMGISDKELMSLFGRPSQDARWLYAADSAENHEVMTYRLERATPDDDPRH
jgi:hypothetical protein